MELAVVVGPASVTSGFLVGEWFSVFGVLGVLGG
jgi:hypothetical protein